MEGEMHLGRGKSLYKGLETNELPVMKEHLEYVESAQTFWMMTQVFMSQSNPVQSNPTQSSLVQPKPV